MFCGLDQSSRALAGCLRARVEATDRWLVSGTSWFLRLGTYKHKTVENHVLEMDNVAVRQLSRSR